MEAVDAFVLFVIVVSGLLIILFIGSIIQRRRDPRTTKACRRCGSKLPGFARFCRQCGEAV